MWRFGGRGAPAGAPRFPGRRGLEHRCAGGRAGRPGAGSGVAGEGTLGPGAFSPPPSDGSPWRCRDVRGSDAALGPASLAEAPAVAAAAKVAGWAVRGCCTRGPGVGHHPREPLTSVGDSSSHDKDAFLAQLLRRIFSIPATGTHLIGNGDLGPPRCSVSLLQWGSEELRACSRHPWVCIRCRLGPLSRLGAEGACFPGLGWRAQRQPMRGQDPLLLLLLLRELVVPGQGCLVDQLTGAQREATSHTETIAVCVFCPLAHGRPHTTQLYQHVPETKLPIVYSPRYNITFLGLEKLHPFDAGKWGKVINFLKGMEGSPALDPPSASFTLPQCLSLTQASDSPTASLSAQTAFRPYCESIFPTGF